MQEQQPLVKPLVDELAELNRRPAPEPGPRSAPKPAELDQDAGGGYNPDRTYPQT